MAGLGGSDNHLDSKAPMKKKTTMGGKAKNGTTNNLSMLDKEPGSKSRKNSMLSGAKEDALKKQYNGFGS